MNNTVLNENLLPIALGAYRTKRIKSDGRVTDNRKAAWRVFVAAAAVCILTVLSLTMFWAGRLSESLNQQNHIEKMMCASQSVDVRELPAGYIIARAPKGAALWLFRLDLPFAHVAYFDGHSWHEGTVSASVLEVCK